METAFKFMLLLILFSACNNEEPKNEDHENDESGFNTEFITAVDISQLPEILSYDPVFYNRDGQEAAFTQILSEHGINTIRLRLWVDPETEHSGFQEVMQFAGSLKDQGFKLWLSVHYSDTWADPGHQEVPQNWQGLSLSTLHDSIYNYTSKIVRLIQADFIQIGNEINSGFLHPYGEISENYGQFSSLMNKAIEAIRNNSDTTKIIIHFAGIEGADWFFNKMDVFDYDIMGLSFYPLWHGKDMNELKTVMQDLSQQHNKEIVIAETAYPFTLGWNDWTNNIVGLEEHLILPDYPASQEGQAAFVGQIMNICKQIEKGVGLCYWGAELIAWKGAESTDASPWENQALFDFNNNAVLAIEEFDRMDK